MQRSNNLRRRVSLLALAALSATLWSAAAGAVEVKLTVKDGAKVARTAAVVTSGVPFAKGAVKDVGRLSVSTGGKVIPAQFTKLAPWDDGSVRWALMDCQVGVAAGGAAGLTVRDDGKNKAPASPVKVTEGGAAVTVSTGPLELVIDRKRPGLFRSVKIDGKERVTGGGRGLVVYLPGEARKVQKKQGRKTITVTERGPGKAVVAGPPSEVVVEQAGPMRAVVRIRGTFLGVHNGLLNYTVRISAFAGQKSLKMHVWLENNGGMGYFRKSRRGSGKQNFEWFLFDGMAVELGLKLGDTPAAECEGVRSMGRFKVLQLCKMNRDGRKLKYNAYEVYQLKDFEYTIGGGGKKPLKTGGRTDGVVTLSGGGGTLTTAVRNFWQNYEKAIEFDNSTLKLWLWPTEGQWPRARIRNRWRGGLFDKTLEASPRPGLYYLPGSVHKGHEIVLDFSERSPKESHAELSSPLFALAPAVYYASTEAAPALFAPPTVRTGEEECDAKLDAWTRMTRSVVDPASPSGLVAARKHSPWSAVGYWGDSLYWYGWLDFGDISVPGVGPSSLHYDWLWVMLLSGMRTGDASFMREAVSMARHRIDVDQSWSDRDPPGANRLQRRDSSYPAFHCNRLYGMPSVSANYLAGVVLYHMLTGDPKALECSTRNAEGLKVAWKSPSGNIAANAWTMHSYIAMHDLTGDKKWLGEALKLFKTNVAAKWKAHGPHLHDRQQIRGQGYTRDDIRYCYAAHIFCLLHHRTGDKKLFELLQAGCDKDFPENFFGAPLFMADLHAYVALKTGKADYADDAVEHWIEGFPESKCPPVFLPNNSQWSRRGAMHLRAGHILQYYFWKRGKK
jgi:exo-rhamnogalacturonan lyase-like protein